MQKNHWVLKDSELKQTLEEYKLVVDPYTRKDAIAAIRLFEADEMIVEEEDGSIKDIEALRKKDPELMVTRVIFHNTSEQDTPYVPAGHNGKAFYIPRETEVDVPDYILNSCIKDAVETRLIPKVEMNGDINWIKRLVQRFPYTIVEASHPAKSKAKGSK